MQAVLECPGFWQWKQSFFLMQRLRSSGVSLETLIVSTTMASGSRTLEVEVLEKEWYIWWEVLEFRLAMSSACFHWVWKVAFLYHSLMVAGMVSMDMMQHINAGGIPAEKYPIRTLGLEMLVRAMWFLNVEIYSVSEGEYELFLFFCMCWVDNQEMAFPVTSWCLNVVLNFVMKLAKVSRVNIVPVMVL